MRLLLVELTRFRSRRAVVLTLLLGALLAVVLAGAAIWETRPVTADDRATAKQQLIEESALAQRDYAACLADPTGTLGEEATAADCPNYQPQLEWFLDRSPLRIAGEVEGRGEALAVLLAGLAIVVGTTFAGADWGSGSIANQLLFTPRRLSVWTAKAAATALGTLAAAAAVLAVFWGMLLVASVSRDIVVPARVVGDVLESASRTLVLAGACALGALALTMLLRRTVATLGLLFAYVVAGELLLNSLPIEKVSQWSLANNILAWVGGGTQVFDESVCSRVPVCQPYLLSAGHAAAFLGGLLLLSIVVSMLSFRRRDID